MAKKKELFDIFSAESLIIDSVAEMKKKMESAKQVIAKGTHMYDALMNEEKGTIKTNIVEALQYAIRKTIADARKHWETSTKALYNLDKTIQNELNSKELTSVRFTRLKKLQAKNIEAKQKMANFNIAKMEEDAYATIARLTRGLRKHYHNM